VYVPPPPQPIASGSQYMQLANGMMMEVPNGMMAAMAGATPQQYQQVCVTSLL
jgi:hypothetical protein